MCNHPCPAYIIANLVSSTNREGTITNSDLELSALVLHKATLLATVPGSRLAAPRPVLDKTTTVSRSTKEASTINPVVGPTYHRYLPSKNLYPLNPEESDIFYFLLIGTKRPKRPKLQRAVSLSYQLHAIKCIPRDNTTLAFLFIILQKADTIVMIRSLGIFPSVFDLALTL